MKKNVLQFIGSFHQGGSERQAVHLFNLLREEKSHRVFLAGLNKEGVLREEIERDEFLNIPEFPLTSFYDLNFARQLKRCVRFLRENRIEIVHTHDFYTNVFGIAAAKLARVPLKIASKRETGGMRSLMQKQIEKRIFKTADAITANSEAVRDYLIRDGISAEKIRVIYNGIDLGRLTPKVTDKKLICENLGLPTDEKIKFVTLVANLRHAVKNQPMFLRVAKEVSEKAPDAHFVLAGEGELKASLENLAKEFGIADKTHFIGRCTQVPELLSISFASVLTSVNEGFSNSILEYMVAQFPVVATRVGGAGEAIDEGETGFLVESNDDRAMANRLLELLSNEAAARRMGERGRKTVEEKFSCEAQLAKTIALYESRVNEK